ncbi:hypothetical protein Rcae01_00735 [Novipirellula caenicola]|uniref:Uncharacterized protein n=1 Tax=Novipirellula caenicola TaxID=1536901 RepID=A0ABP9VJA1_9BACT
MVRVQTRSQSPEGAAGIAGVESPIVPSGLTAYDVYAFHGLTPMATTCRHFVAGRESRSDGSCCVYGGTHDQCSEKVKRC